MPSQLSLTRSLRDEEISTLVLGLGLTTLAMTARIYTKLRLTKCMRREDYTSILSWVCFMGYVGLGIIICRQSGNVRHVAFLSIIETKLYSPAMLLAKISILLQYTTIFVTRRRSAVNYAIHTLIWVNVLYYTITTLFAILQCKPIQKVWNPEIPGHCIESRVIWIISGVVNVLSDFSILILPLPLIWRLQIPKNKKLSIIAVFGVGLLASITSIIRLVYSIELYHVVADTPKYVLNQDRIGIWSFVEIAIGLIVGCLPVLPRFFQHVSGRISTTSSSNRNALSASGNSWMSGSWRGYFSIIWSSSGSLNNSNVTPRRPSYGFSFGTKRSESSAPRNSRASFSDTLLPMTEINLPQAPLPVGSRVTHSAPRMTTTEDARYSLGKECNVEYKSAGISVTKEVHIEHHTQSSVDDHVPAPNPWDCIDPGDLQALRKL